MSEKLKSIFYFPIASYFRFFAQIRLNKWKPRIIVVTGSSGKTTLLHLLESQLRDKAKFSHHANSSYGIPFDILDLQRKTLRSSEWITLFLKAPFHAFHKPFEESLYVVEADTDRPGEGKFLAELLKPEVVLWTSISATHGMNFDHLVTEGKFSTVEEAIAYDFGYFLEYCSELAVIDGDSHLQAEQVKRTKAKVKAIKKKEYLDSYAIERYGTTFIIKEKKYILQSFLPEEVFYGIVMCEQAITYFDLPFDKSFSEFILPEGRGILFSGIKETMLIDSTYNANLSSMEATLNMFGQYPSKKKWVVLGDMLELGKREQEEHEMLAEVLAKMDLERVILVGKRVGKYTFGKLDSIKGIKNIRSIMGFQNQKDALTYIQENIQGGEAILFKGSQSLFLEGIIEPLLKDKKEAAKLPRRADFWEEKRMKIYG